MRERRTGDSYSHGHRPEPARRNNLRYGGIDLPVGTSKPAA
jgi:hypothetical protein